MNSYHKIRLVELASNNNQLLVFSQDGYIGSKYGCGINGYTQSGTSSSTVYRIGACL